MKALNKVTKVMANVNFKSHHYKKTTKNASESTQTS